MLKAGRRKGAGSTEIRIGDEAKKLLRRVLPVQCMLCCQHTHQMAINEFRDYNIVVAKDHLKLLEQSRRLRDAWLYRRHVPHPY